MQLKSIIVPNGTAVFPKFMAERVYMREFYKSDGLPEDLERWQTTVDAMLDGIDTKGPIYIMIDEKETKAGVTHRRNGLHVDGYWNPSLSCHNTSGHSSSPVGGHNGGIYHRPTPMQRHRGLPPSYKPTKKSSWNDATFDEPEAIILCSSLSAARGYTGVFDGPVGEGGSCSHIDLSGLVELPMEANVVYAGNVSCLHESLPVETDCLRQLVRLNVPGWSPQ